MDLSCGLAHPPWEDPEGTSFFATVRNKLVRGIPLPSKNSVVALLCRSDITVGIPGDLNIMGIIECQ